MLEPIVDISFIEAFWDAVKHSRGTSHPQTTRYQVVDIADEKWNTLPLVDLWKDLQIRLEEKSRLSDEEKDLVKRTMKKMEIFHLEAVKDRKERHVLLKRLFHSSKVKEDLKWIGIHRELIAAYLNPDSSSSNSKF